MFILLVNALRGDLTVYLCAPIRKKDKGAFLCLVLKFKI